METSPRTAQIVSLAAVREITAKQRNQPRRIPTKQVDTPVDGVVYAQLTAHSPQVDGQAKQVDTKLTPAEKAARWLQQPNMLQWLKSQYAPDDAAAVLTGSILLAAHIKPGEEARTTDIIKATVTDGISYRLLNDKCKPFLTHAKIWNKISGKEYRWANYKKPSENAGDVQIDANDVQMQQSNVQIDTDNSANDRAPMSDPTPAKNPVEKFRQWQRDRYLHKAKADVWSKVLDDGTVQTIPKPGHGEMTEKQKELHRKAAWADHEAKLKLKIDQSSNKELAQQIQRADMEAVQQERAILNAARIKAAETRHNRQVAWERAKPFIYLGAAALIGFSLYNNQPNTTHYPAVTTTIPPVQQGKIHESP